MTAATEELLEHIDEPDDHREKQCQPFLAKIVEHLCREQPTKVLVSGREQPSRYGYNDFCVSAAISDGGCVTRKVAYVWEVKSPQSYIMECDDHQLRLRPTKALIKAESQLIHYVTEFRESSSFRSYFELDPLSEIVAAGIIIGRGRSPVRPSSTFKPDADLQKLYQISMFNRNHFLYRSAGIVIKNWNWVHELIHNHPKIGL